MDTKYPPTPQNAGETKPADPALQKAKRAGYEPRDVSVTGLFIFAGSLLATIFVIFAGVFVALKVFDKVDRALAVRRSRTEPGAISQVHRQPDYEGPLLQVKPEEDLRWMRSHDEIDLNRYGWVDRKAGVVQMPVDRAMDLLAQRGLPPVSPGVTIEMLQRQRADPQVFGQTLRP